MGESMPDLDLQIERVGGLVLLHIAQDGRWFDLALEPSVAVEIADYLTAAADSACADRIDVELKEIKP